MTWGYLVQRLVQVMLTLFGLSIIVFVLTRITGDPVALMLGQDASQEAIAHIQQKLGLDQPLLVQYAKFVFQAIQGDFGNSITWQAPAVDLILDRFPATFLLALSSMIVGLVIAIPLGVLGAIKRDTWLDHLARLLGLVGQSMPTFWIGIILILLFALHWPIFPTSGYGGIEHLILPSLTLGGFVAASVMRVTRSAMLSALESDYIRSARAKGLSEWRVVWSHALRNAAIPIVTITAIQAATILRGTVVTETVFAWPGIGKIAVAAVYNRDFPLVQGAVLFMGVVFTVVNLSADLLYAYLDPRIRYGKR